MKTEIKSNIFDLTEEQIETSKMFYDDKIIKCLVAPYHSYAMLEKIIPFTKTTYLYPERELTLEQTEKFVSMLVNSKTSDEIRIITANQNIILDMIDSCVRVLTEDNRVVDCPCKTLLANIHDIRYKILENPHHRISKEEESKSKKKVGDLIDKINSNCQVTKSEYDRIIKDCDIIGESIIREKLKQMASRQLKIK